MRSARTQTSRWWPKRPGRPSEPNPGAGPCEIVLDPSGSLAGPLDAWEHVRGELPRVIPAEGQVASGVAPLEFTTVLTDEQGNYGKTLAAGLLPPQDAALTVGLSHRGCQVGREYDQESGSFRVQLAAAGHSRGGTSSWT